MTQLSPIWATRLPMQIQARGQIQCYPYLESWVLKSKKIVSAFVFLPDLFPSKDVKKKKNNDDKWLMNPVRIK